MRRISRGLFYVLTLVAGACMTRPAFAQTDPKLLTPTVLVSGTAIDVTSDPYACILAATGETINFLITTPDAGTGIVYIDGTTDEEAKVLADTAEWVEVGSTATFPDIITWEDPPSYVRVRVDRTTGTIRVTLRGSNNTKFRKVQ